MTDLAVADAELRVLLKMVTARDESMVVDVLKRAGVHAEICEDAADISNRLREGVGAFLIAEEVLASAGFEQVRQVLRSQPPWSDVPMVVLARAGADSAAIGALTIHMGYARQHSTVKRQRESLERN